MNDDKEAIRNEIKRLHRVCLDSAIECRRLRTGVEKIATNLERRISNRNTAAADLRNLLKYVQTQ